ncbi:MAG: pyridoxamine 5'-phosphate oxidase family protein [Pseudomonadota bacterium]
MLSETVQEFVDEWRLGHIATTGPEGPNVSPKGTFQALDASRIAFAEIRSPNTIANLAHDARVEVNMVDVFSRKGARFRGDAVFHAMETAEADTLAPRWTEVFGAELMGRASGFVVIAISEIKPLITPAYDVGATEQALRQDYLARFSAMQEAWFAAHE